jgi:hypothetical protein
MKTTVAILLSLLALATTSSALADGTTPGPVYTTEVVHIIGRRVQPIAAIEVARALPSIKLHEMKTPFTARIEAGVASDPF